jgi:hypothetical protein
LSRGSLHREHELALAEVEGNEVEQREVDLDLRQVDRGHPELPPEVGDRELLGEDVLPHEDARQPLAVGALQCERLRQLGGRDEVRLQQDLAELFSSHPPPPPRC